MAVPPKPAGELVTLPLMRAIISQCHADTRRCLMTLQLAAAVLRRQQGSAAAAAAAGGEGPGMQDAAAADLLSELLAALPSLTGAPGPEVGDAAGSDGLSRQQEAWRRWQDGCREAELQNLVQSAEYKVGAFHRVRGASASPLELGLASVAAW